MSLYSGIWLAEWCYGKFSDGNEWLFPADLMSSSRGPITQFCKFATFKKQDLIKVCSRTWDWKAQFDDLTDMWISINGYYRLKKQQPVSSIAKSTFVLCTVCTRSHTVMHIWTSRSNHVPLSAENRHVLSKLFGQVSFDCIGVGGAWN